MNLKRLAKSLNEMSEDLMDKKVTKDDIAEALNHMGFQEIQKGIWVPKEAMK